MSIEAINWALNLAPVPMDHGKRGSHPNSACAAVLIGLANHAGPDGRNAFPGVPRLVRYTRLSERTVRTAIDRLAAEAIILPGDPAIVAAFIKRGDRRPEVWDLDMTLIRGDLTAADLTDLERQFPGLGQRLTSEVQPLHPVSDSTDEVQPMHPATNGVHWLHPATPDGVQSSPNGVQPSQPRGATVAPKPSREPSVEPPHTPSGCEGRASAPAHTHADTREETTPSEETNTQSELPGTNLDPPKAILKKGSTAGRATRIPDDFALTEGMRVEAAERWPALDVDAEFAEFVNYWRHEAAKSKARKVDWLATWRKSMGTKWDMLPSWRRRRRDPMHVEAVRGMVDEWWDWARKQGPVIGKTRDDLERLAVDALAGGATIEQIRAALSTSARREGVPIPGPERFQRLLWGKQAGYGNGYSKPAPTNRILIGLDDPVHAERLAALGEL